MNEQLSYQSDLAIYEISESLRDIVLIPFIIEFSGTDLPSDELVRGVVASVNQHTVLLSRFRITHSGVDHFRGVPADRSEISIHSAQSVGEVIQELRSTMIPISCDGRPWRIGVLENAHGAAKSLVGLMHHMAVDGYSLQLFLTSLCAELEDPGKSEDPGKDAERDGFSVYGGFTSRVRSRLSDPTDVANAQAYWRENLADLPSNPFGSLTPRRLSSNPKHLVLQERSVRIPKSAVYSEICKRLGISEFALFHGIVLAALHAGGVPLDAPLLTPTDLRDSLETLDSVGNYSNMSILRSTAAFGVGFGRYLKIIAETDIRSSWYGYLPLSAVLASIGEAGRRSHVVGPGIASISLSYGRDYPPNIQLTNGVRVTPRPVESTRSRHLIVFDLKPNSLIGGARPAFEVAAGDQLVVRYDADQCESVIVDWICTFLDDILVWLATSEFEDVERHWPPLDSEGEFPLPSFLADLPDEGSPCPGDEQPEDRSLVDALRESFSRVMGLESPVSADAGFFDVGGYSLLALLVADDLGQGTKYPVRVEDILTFQTPRAIARHHRGQFEDEEPTIELRRGTSSGPGPVYVYFPPATGRSGCYYGLAGAIPNVASLLVHLPNKVSDRFDGEHMARTAIDAAGVHLAKLECASVVCVGWSAGGMLAAHAASHLRLVDPSVRIDLVLVDSYPSIATDYADIVATQVGESDMIEAALKASNPLFDDLSRWYRRSSCPATVPDLNVLHIQSEQSCTAGYRPLSWKSLSDKEIATARVSAPHVSMLSSEGSLDVAERVKTWVSMVGEARR